jgi:hypothetical protein
MDRDGGVSAQPRALVGWLVVDLLALAFTVRRRGWPRSARLPFVLTYPHLWTVWTGDAFDVTRHALAASFQLPVGLSLLSVAALDAFMSGVGRRVRRR